MLRSIIRFSLRRRAAVLVLACALLGYGVYSLSIARYDVFPDFAPAEVVIQTSAPGLSPEQVEQLVTTPLESEIVGVNGVQTVRSSSIQELSVITVIFSSGTNIYRDRQLVAERLPTVTLPSGIKPIITPLTSSTSTVLEVGLSSKQLSLMDLSTAADWVVKPRLLAVPGVAKVAVFGDERRQLQIQYDPERLIRHEVSVNDIIAAAQRSTAVRGAGFVSTGNQRIILQSLGQSRTGSQIGSTVVMRQNGADLTLGDLGHVIWAPVPPIGGASISGKPSLILMISAQYGANTLEVTRGLDTALSELKPGLRNQHVELHANIFRPASFIETALHNIRVSLMIGAILVVIVLFLFLFNLRTAVISCTAIPLSLLGASIVLERFGFSFNTITLGGLAIAVGEVVDDAVIDVENIYRRLRESRAQLKPRAAWRIVLDASIEVRSAVIYATFAVILVFFPVLTMSGVAGRIFSPLAIAYISAILISLLVALTVTPALCLVLLANRDLALREPPLVEFLKRIYQRLLAGVERIPGLVIGTVTAAVLLVAILIAPSLEASFIPPLREGNLTLHMTTVPGTSVRQSLELGERVTEALERLPYLSLVAQRVGRAELSDDTNGTHSSEFELGLKPLNSSQYDAALAAIRNTVSGFVGAVFSVNSFLVERINEILSGYSSGVAVNIFGSDLNVLDIKAKEIARALSSIPGVNDVTLQSPPGMPQVNVRLRPEELTRWGFDSVEVLDAIRTAFDGDIVGEIYQGNRVFSVSVILDPLKRRRVTDIGDLPLRGPDGNWVQLRELADIYESAGRYLIQHDGARRLEAVTCNLTGIGISAFMTQARRRFARISLPQGTYIAFTGQVQEQERTKSQLLVHALLAGIGIVLLLSIVIGNYQNLLLVMTNLPFALVGGVLAAWITGGNLSLGALVGFVTLFGITLRNSIMLISHYEHLVSVEGMQWDVNTAMRGAAERLSPILMTALVTGLGLLPLALGSGDPGREIEGPMAIVILGGLFTSTALNLIVLPTLALRYGRFTGGLALRRD
jgi:CzcA family heavy metal efflux pump